MLRNVNAVSYTREQIASLRGELDCTLPEEIATIRRAINLKENEIHQSKMAEAQFVRENISPLLQRQSDLQARMREIELQAHVMDYPRGLANIESQIASEEVNRDRAATRHLTQQQVCHDLYRRLSEAKQLLATSSWQKDIDQLNVCLSQHRLAFEDARRNLSSIGASIRRMESEISSLELLNSIDTTMHVMDYSRHHSSYGHHHHHGHYGHGFAHTVNDVSRNIQLANYRSELTRLRGEREFVLQCVNRAESEVNRVSCDLAAKHRALSTSDIFRNVRQLDLQYQEAGNALKSQDVLLSDAEKKLGIALQVRESFVNDHQRKTEQLTVATNAVAKSSILGLLHMDYPTVIRELGEVTSMLQQNETVKNNLRQRIQQYENQLAVETAALERINNRWLLLQSDPFLAQYHQLSEQDQARTNLFVSLRSSLHSALTKFEDDYPALQSLETRLILSDLLKQVNFLDYVQEAALQERYWMLTGLIYTALDRSVEVNTELTTMLVKTLQDHLLDKDQALQSFHRLKMNNPDYLASTSLESLRQAEAQEYQRALSAYESQLASVMHIMTHHEECLYQHAQTLLRCIRELEKTIPYSAPLVYDETFDVKFHTQVLRATKDLLLEPSNVSCQQRVEKLALHNPYGKPSDGRRGVGVLTMLLGAAMIVGALVAGVFSFGLTAPLTIAGLALGSAAFVMGLGVYLSGRQRGLDKALHSMHAASFFYQMPQHHEASYVSVQYQPTAPVYGT